MKLSAKTLALVVCLAGLVGCSSQPAANSPNPHAVASPAPGQSSSPTVGASASPDGTSSPNFLTGSNAKEEPVQNTKAGFRVTIPAGWKSAKKDHLLVMSSPDEAFMMMFLTQADGAPDVSKDLDKLLGNMMTEVRPEGPAQDVDFNGMKTSSTTGQGKMGERAMVWSLNLIRSKQTFVMVTVYDPSRVEQHRDEILKIGPSIQPIKD